MQMTKIDQSMRGHMATLEALGELHTVAKQVDPAFEISTILSLREHGAAQLFNNVCGHDMPVIGNIYNKRERFEQALNIAAGTLDQHCLQALKNPIKPVVVSKAPVQEICHHAPLDIGKIMPVPMWFEKERAPYITAGVIVAKDPETGKRNVSIARFRLEGGTKLMAGIAKNHHLAQLAEKAQKLGKKLEIAVAIGNHAAVLLGSQLYLELGDDEFDNAGALLGEAIELVKCKTIDIEVPAHAEIIIEGLLDANDLIEEGAVSEFPGFYVYYGPGIGMDVTCVTHRKDAIYQAILPGYAAEHCLLGAVAIGATLTKDLQRSIPSVRRVFVTEGGMGRLHAVITMHRPRAGEGKRAIILAMGCVNLLKLVTVVEDDINPEDPRAVEWSLAARFRGHEDMVILPGIKADRCDPVHQHLTITKIGMVAATREGDGEAGGLSEFVRQPQDVIARITQQLNEY